jgi:glyoxylase-like metal-dependent hydrolase (beta-lactamase superfamily II)
MGTEQGGALALRTPRPAGTAQRGVIIGKPHNIRYKECPLLKITDNVFVIPGIVANPFIIVDADGLTLIDAGLPRSQKKILAYVAGLGKSPRDIKRILITHADLDHVGSLAALHNATGARTYASQTEAQAIAAGKSSRQIKRRGFSFRRLLFALLGPVMKAKPFQVDEIVADGQVLPLAAGGLRVLDTSGHTPGHISFYSPTSGVLFCGDSMVSDERGLHGSRPGLTWDDAKAKEAVKRQAALNPRIVCPGHGPVVMDAAGKFPV